MARGKLKTPRKGASIRRLEHHMNNTILMVRVGSANKVKLFHCAINTKRPFESIVNDLIQKDIKENPSLYENHIDLHADVKKAVTLEDKITVILRYEKGLRSKRFLSSKLCKYDKPSDRKALGGALSLVLGKPQFFNKTSDKVRKNKRNVGKHMLFGLTEWLPKVG